MQSNDSNNQKARRWRSCARWAHKHGFEHDLTTDLHDSKAAAVAVCDMLMRDGLGGERCHYPLDTWVEEAPVEAERRVEKEPRQGLGAVNGSVPFPDIGKDPLKTDGGEREVYFGHEAILARLHKACSLQQKEVPDQTALVWRADLSHLLGQFAWREAGHKRAIEREEKAKALNSAINEPSPD